MALFTDQTGNTISLTSAPKRIVSLVPSQTELLADLGLEHEVVGITKFCVHPNEWFRNKTRVGGTKDVKTDRVTALSPDLIIANKEENVKEQVEALRSIAPVWTSDINTLQDAYEMIRQIGHITEKEKKAGEIIQKTELGFTALQKQMQQAGIKTCVYLIWKDPYMTIGSDTFIHDMLRYCGFYNLFAESKRYPETTVEALQSLSPECILLSSEPYPFAHKHIEAMQHALPGTPIELVDGEMFSWYGSRLMQAPAYFCGLLNRINSSSTDLKS
ncbi:MAG TPA: cobalamin-binding protein [Chitinophagaceae bacterium]|nr:cobalamin-binding protein [Chitinophagaceae bacterium]